jgi:hypothetical protein
MVQDTAPADYFEYHTTTDNIAKIIESYDQLVWEEPAGKPVLDAGDLPLNRWLTQSYQGASPDRAIRFAIDRNYDRILAGVTEYYRVQVWIYKPVPATAIDKLRSVGYKS